LGYTLALRKPGGRIVTLSLVIFLCLPLLSAAQATPPGKVILIWTAPGDDNYIGQAAGYDIRYQSAALGPLDSDYEWTKAHTVSGEPIPSPAGHTDSMIIGGLDYGASYYFCIRTFDRAGNLSLMSNSPLAVSGDYVECPYKLGDINGDGIVNIFDITYLLKYLYMEGSPPIPLAAGDTNASGNINIFDITLLTSFLYFGNVSLECVYDQ
jgi:hypothetical protein